MRCSRMVQVAALILLAGCWPPTEFAGESLTGGDEIAASGDCPAEWCEDGMPCNIDICWLAPEDVANRTCEHRTDPEAAGRACWDGGICDASGECTFGGGSV